MRKGATFLTALVIAGALSLPVKAQDTPTADTVVATVNDRDITLGHMIIAFNSLPAQYQQLPPEVLFNGILDQLIRQTALYQSFDGEMGLATRLSLENEERSLIAAQAVEQVMAGAASEEDIQAAYDAQYADGGGEEYNASHILVETEEEAIAIVEELKAGADFAEMAREKSTGPSGPGGGSLGWFGPGQMVPDFETAVVALEVSEVSEPVQTQFGWHVILLNEKRIKDAPALEDVRDELTLEIQQAAVQAHIETLVEAADVVRPDVSGIDPSAVSNIDLLSE